MTSPIPPSLERFGEDLSRAAHRELSTHSGRAQARRSRSRLLAAGTLGLAGVGAALVLALSGSAAPPAFAITRANDGSVLVKFNYAGPRTLLDVDGTLIAKYHETILVNEASGPATVKGPVLCVPTSDPAGNLPSGPAVRVLLGDDGTGIIPTGDTGAGTVHLTSCHAYVSYPNSNTGAGNSGNTGAG
jgi:hypothetical protein